MPNGIPFGFIVILDPSAEVTGLQYLLSINHVTVTPFEIDDSVYAVITGDLQQVSTDLDIIIKHVPLVHILRW